MQTQSTAAPAAVNGTAPVFLVCLRQPASRKDYREDPYWEVGSFGCTGCHHTNLLHRGSNHIPPGARLAFAQGGPDGSRLVLLTPPVRVIDHGDRLEVRWKARMPFKYSAAPLLIDGQGKTDAPKLKRFISTSNSKLWRHKLSSKCRSKSEPLPDDVAAELVAVFDADYAAGRGHLADTYLDAIPPWPAWEHWSRKHEPFTPADRRAAYKERYASLKRNGSPCCRRKC